MGLESVELVMAWERSFAISIPNNRAAILLTPALAADAVEEILAKEGRPLPFAEIERIIRNATLEVTGMNPEDHRREGKFVEDFGLD